MPEQIKTSCGFVGKTQNQTSLRSCKIEIACITLSDHDYLPLLYSLLSHLKEGLYNSLEQKKSRIRETKHLLTDADSIAAAKKLLGIFFIPPRRNRRRRRQGAFIENKNKNCVCPYLRLYAYPLRKKVSIKY